MYIYEDKNRSTKERTEDLISRMTLEEKISQMHVTQFWNKLKDQIKDVISYGGVYFVGVASKRKEMRLMRELQRYAVENTRLHIPLLFYGEGVHGLLWHDAVIFPQNIAAACSFDRRLINAVAREIGREARSLGIRQLLAPDLDLARDPRWGRVQETYGEDTYLASELGAEYVKGLKTTGVVPTLKHYIGYGSPENGINLSSSRLGEREIRELMLPVFEKCVKAGAGSVMPAYCDIDGEPMHVSEKWLGDVLRREIGFEGVVISDWQAMGMLDSFCRTADGPEDIGRQCIDAGIDIEAPSVRGYGEEFLAAVRRGEIGEEKIDRAVRRILYLKFELGLFDEKFSCSSAKIRTASAVGLARKVAERSIVLLKNDGVLPLTGKEKTAVIGPGAKRVQLGDYTNYPKNGKYLKSIYDGIADIVGAENVLYAQGCNVTEWRKEQIGEAVEVAKKADVIVLCCSDNSEFFGGVGWGNEVVNEPVLCSEGFDVHDLRLPEGQRILLDELKKTGKKVILLLSTGRPCVITEEFGKADAVLQTWYAGEQGGLAAADVLFGKADPTGKLSVSFPYDNGNLPCYYNYRKTCRGRLYDRPGSPGNPGRGYVFAPPNAFLPFGYGLGYVPVKYLSLKAESDGENVTVRVKIRNEGDRSVEESVLVFVETERSETVPYVRLLKEFRRVRLPAGKTKTVVFTLTADAFTYIDRKMKKARSKGKNFIYVSDLAAEVDIGE